MKSIQQRVSEKEWSQDWPERVASDFGAKSSIDASSLRSFSSTFSSTRAEIDAITGQGSPVQLTNVMRLLDRLQSWNSNHRSFMTWPPTISAWSRAVRDTARNDPYEFFVVAAAYPNAVHASLENWPGLKGCHAASLYVEAYDRARAPAPKVDQGSKISNSEEASSPVPENAAPPAPAPQSPIKAVSPTPLTPKAAPPAPAWAVDLLSMTRKLSASSHRGLDAELIDGFIKQQIHQKKGTSDEAAGYWFEDELIPALSHFSSRELEDVIAGWPPGLQFPLNNVLRTVGSGRFWSALKVAGDDTRATMLSEVLPTLTDTVFWRAVDRYQMLAPMFEMAKSSGEFTKRLELWLAWGGDLDAQIPDPSTDSNKVSEDAFHTEAVPMMSARRWFQKQENPRWDTALEAFPVRVTGRNYTP